MKYLKKVPFNKIFCIGYLLTSLSLLPLAQTKDPIVVRGELGTRLDQYLTRLAGYGFSGTVLIAQGNDLVLHKGYGLADVARKVPNTTATVYDIASLAKQFTAAALLKLEMQGKLKTSDALSRYFNGVPEEKRGITLHQLLTHSSGLPFDCPSANTLNRPEFVKCMLDTKLIAPPGKQYFYSNGGYGLLAALIEQVAGQSYETYLIEQLFQPAGLSSTGFTGSVGKWSEEIVAHGYDEGIERVVPTGLPFTWRLRGAAGIVTSVGDLYRWELALREQKILSTAASEKLFTAHVPTDGQDGQYGYGWGIRKMERGGRVISHDGITTDGFNALFQRFVDDGYIMIAASNSFAGRYHPMALLAPAINAFLFGPGLTPPPAFITLPAATMASYSGVYRLPSGAQLHISAASDKLLIGAEGQEAIEFLAAVEPAQARLLTSYNERTATLINGAHRGNYTPAVKAFAGQMNADQARQTIKNWLSKLEEKNGSLKSLDLLGTAPEPGIARSFVRLNFEHGTELRRLRWEGGLLGNIVIAQLPILTTTFRPQTATEFTGFHLGIARNLGLRFVLNATGAVQGIAFDSPSGVAVQAIKLSAAPMTQSKGKVER